MGCGSSSAPVDYISSQLSQEESVTEWKQKLSTSEARRQYEGDGTLSRESSTVHLELRGLMVDPIAQPVLGEFAKKLNCVPIFMCWIDIQEFKAVEVNEYRLSKALNIYDKYIKQGSPMDVISLDDPIRAEINQDLELMKSESDTGTGIVPSSFFNNVQNHCFKDIHAVLFSVFKKTEEYVTLTRTIKQSYNYVRTEDFLYLKKLGQGGFGVVVQCIKKSTGQHYAMKIQTKRGLLSCFPDDPWRADFEKQALVSAQHPFIINLEYAFQTDALAIMVMGLGTAGDLRHAIVSSPNKQLPFNRVQFYAAEIVLGISALHSMGLMYRDLKPNNVLLNADGHIQLVDLGSVTDADGLILGVPDEIEDMAPVFAPASAEERKVIGLGLAQFVRPPTHHFRLTKNVNKEEDKEYYDFLTTQKRALTIIGTYGYMAPEMVLILSQSRSERVGYTNIVDWWSLGATIYKLFTNSKPFPELTMDKMLEIAPQYHGDMKFVSRYALLFQEIPEHPNICPVAMDLIRKLLNTNERYRLGSGKNGVRNIKNHPFFDGVDWHKMEERLIPPPFVPVAKPLNNTPQFAAFDDMIMSFGKEAWLTDLPKWSQQRYFSNWDFTSPMTLKLECGVFNAKKEKEEQQAIDMKSSDLRDNDGSYKQMLVQSLLNFFGRSKKPTPIPGDLPEDPLQDRLPSPPMCPNLAQDAAVDTNQPL